MNTCRILFYIKDPNGGTGKFIEHIYEALADSNDFEIKVLTHIAPHDYDFESDQVGHELPKQGAFSFIPFIKSLQNFVGFLLYVRRYSPHIIYSFDIYSNIAANLLKVINRKILVINSSNVNITRHIQAQRKSYFSQIIRLLIFWLYPKGDLHIVPSQGLKQELIATYNLDGNKIHHLIYPLNIKKILQLSIQPIQIKLPRRSIRITTIVRNDIQKDIFSVIKAIQALSYERPNIVVEILGIQKLPSDIMKKFPQSLIKKHVLCLGWQKNPYNYIKNSDIFLLLTKYEGLSYAIMEAQTLGVPVIASDVDYGPRELIQHNKNGILLKDNKVDTIVKNLNYVLENLELRNSLRTNAIKSAERYDQKKILPLYMNLFQSLHNGTKSK